ncbi:ABC transporter ATP-binding protein [Prosthecomicrobium pneumaticum]|uniref:Multiple sugar transport system ATP-binding protein n=1 Tax=Prosthecomicrobium pneumaticum TaxID=81895 RepID=A0A7W9CW23_9HYPH|nr:ABC transporter ATP-binding protein [Prosthecomicrobium pneumaticum]MBB5752571.1 multiple sugar transport system ATP-binding protein [Prosthecomicrobium pneumaticum]
MTTIRLENLVKSFGSFTALKTMDLEIGNGEFVALLGPSGCGKSTTMNMIAGMEAPTSGRILFDGRDMAGVPMGKRGVGFVFQNYAIFTHMTVRQNLAYGPKARGWPKAKVDAAVAKIADFLQLTPMLDQKSAKLSVNILQRLAIGRSAIVEPAIFLLDEPLSNVDAAFRAVMRTELKHLQREFRQTMVYVTHDQLEAMTMADRIAVMDHGVLQQVGTPIEVYNDPVNLFVARFIGAPGMNLVEGTLAETDRGLAVDLGAFGLSPPLPAALAGAARTAGAKEVVYGFRPEEVTLRTEGPGLRAAVGFVERIGARTIVHFGAADRALKIVAEPSTAVSVGETLSIEPVAASVRLFDKASGRAIKGAA